MNDNSKLKRPSILSHPSFRNMIGISTCILLIVSGVLFFLEGPYSAGIIKPKWYRDIRRSIPGVARSDQRRSMLVILKTLKSSGLVSTKPSNDDPPLYDFQDGGTDLWGTPFQFETTNDILSIRSAGPDKKLFTSDDLVYRDE